MLTDLKPWMQRSTLDTIKRMAKILTRTTGIPHHEALEAISKQKGYQNYRHALNELKEPQ